MDYLDRLLKYNLEVFHEGHLYFKLQPPLLFILSAVLLVLVLVASFYRRTPLAIHPVWRAVLIGLRLVSLALLLLILLEPILAVPEVTLQKGFLVVLMDESQSMAIRDRAGGRERLHAVKNLLGFPSDSDGLLPRLEEAFKVRLMTFGEQLQRVNRLDLVEPKANRTNLGQALEAVAAEFRGLPLAGVVLLSDGADNGERALPAAANLLRSQNIPVYPVGFGRDKIDQDLEIVKVSTAKTLRGNSITDLFVSFRQRGYTGHTVNLEVREGDRLVKLEPVTLGQEGEIQRVRMSLAPDREGLFAYTVGIQPLAGESIDENNQQEFLLENKLKIARVLYIEGLPRKEFAPIKRALDADPHLQLVSLLRITRAGLLQRQGIRHPRELEHGYPSLKEDLDQFDAVIFGSIEASYFTRHQLQITADFVRERGGGFLMLGGLHALDTGGYANTPLADVLPVYLKARQSTSIGYEETFKAVLTPEGRLHPIMRLTLDPQESLERWARLPELVGRHQLTEAKPGAMVLAVDGGNRDAVVVAIQQYGRGRSMVFTSPSSWRWRMLLPSSDDSHERFWQQALRWLAFPAPGQVTLNLDKETYQEGTVVPLKVRVGDRAYTPVSGAQVRVQITTPAGNTAEVPLEWSFGEPGVYRAEYRPSQEGVHKVTVIAILPDQTRVTENDGFNVTRSILEYNNPVLRADLLGDLASITGGRYFTPEEADQLPEAIRPVKQESSIVIERHLRDVPLWFVLVVLFLAVEWFLRRHLGLS